MSCANTSFCQLRFAVQSGKKEKKEEKKDGVR
jgi:hypothetical protein